MGTPDLHARSPIRRQPILCKAGPRLNTVPGSLTADGCTHNPAMEPERVKLLTTLLTMCSPTSSKWFLLAANSTTTAPARLRPEVTGEGSHVQAKKMGLREAVAMASFLRKWQRLLCRNADGFWGTCGPPVYIPNSRPRPPLKASDQATRPSDGRPPRPGSNPGDRCSTDMEASPRELAATE